jgi:hypothetical protein
MTAKQTKPFRMAPLQQLTVKPIEDPAEQSALDERLKQSAEDTDSHDMEDRAHGKLTAAEVLALCSQLSADARLLVASELTAQLSPEQRIELSSKGN